MKAIIDRNGKDLLQYKNKDKIINKKFYLTWNWVNVMLEISCQERYIDDLTFVLDLVDENQSSMAVLGDVKVNLLIMRSGYLQVKLKPGEEKIINQYDLSKPYMHLYDCYFGKFYPFYMMEDVEAETSLNIFVNPLDSQIGRSSAKAWISQPLIIRNNGENDLSTIIKVNLWLYKQIETRKNLVDKLSNILWTLSSAETLKQCQFMMSRSFITDIT